LSGIPWARRKPAAKKPTIPWQEASKTQPVKNPPSKPHTQASKAKHLQDGIEAENLALAFLLARGLYLIDRNFRCRCGELDLIMQDQHTAVVIEVRLRNNAHYGSAQSSVGPVKQRRVSLCAQRWWQLHGQRQFTLMRFDVVAITEGQEPVWIQNAWLISN